MAATWRVESILLVPCAVPQGTGRREGAACSSLLLSGQSTPFLLCCPWGSGSKVLNLAKMHILIYSRNSNWPQANNNCMRIFHLAPSPLSPFRGKTAALRSEGEGKLNKKHIEGTTTEWEKKARISEPTSKLTPLWSASETISLCLLLCKQ